MKLPAGATGFDTPAIDEADVRAFTAVCHHAARTTGGTVTRVIPAGQTPNFHTIEISYRSQRIAVLRHTALPLAAFTEPRAEGDITLRFVDHPDLAAAITDVSDIQVLTAAQLSGPLSRANLDDLSPAERSQIAQWQPNSIGDLLFNFWD
jgi:hypothetical protein